MGSSGWLQSARMHLPAIYLFCFAAGDSCFPVAHCVDMGQLRHHPGGEAEPRHSVPSGKSRRISSQGAET